MQEHPCPRGKMPLRLFTDKAGASSNPQAEAGVFKIFSSESINPKVRKTDLYHS